MGGGDPPMVAYVYAPDRKAERPEAHLGTFAGILQVDGYSGYAALAWRRQQVQLACCATIWMRSVIAIFGCWSVGLSLASAKFQVDCR